MQQLLRMSFLEQRSCPCFHLPGLDKQTHPALTNDLRFPCKYPSAPPFHVFFLQFCFCTLSTYTLMHDQPAHATIILPPLAPSACLLPPPGPIQHCSLPS